MLWSLFLLVAALLWAVQRQWSTRRQRVLAKLLKTTFKAWPIIGHSYKFLGSDEDIMKTIHDIGKDAIAMGGKSKFYYFSQLFIITADPVVAESLLTECLEKHPLLKVFILIIGNGSFIAPVPVWRPRRKMIAPIFNSNILKQFVDLFSKRSIEMCDLLKKEVGQGTFSFWDYITVNSLTTSFETTMGVALDDIQIKKLIITLQNLWEVGVYVIFRPWFRKEILLRFLPAIYKPFEIRSIVSNLLTEIINEKRKLITTAGTGLQSQIDDINLPGKYNHTKMVSFLGKHLNPEDKAQKFTDQELYEESLTLLVAAFDSSATGAAFTVLMLSRHLDVQDKVYQELQEVFGDSHRPATNNDLSQLKYLDLVIKETLRLYPVAPMIIREVNKDVRLKCGLNIVKGCGAVINIWAIHRNPAYWGADAEQFRPERFLDSPPKHPAAFMPFSFGPRNCVGYRYAILSMKTVVSTLLRRYRVLPPPGVAPEEPLHLKYNLLVKHVDNYQIRIEPRPTSNLD